MYTETRCGIESCKAINTHNAIDVEGVRLCAPAKYKRAQRTGWSSSSPIAEVLFLLHCDSVFLSSAAYNSIHMSIIQYTC